MKKVLLVAALAAAVALVSAGVCVCSAGQALAHPAAEGRARILGPRVGARTRLGRHLQRRSGKSHRGREPWDVQEARSRDRLRARLRKRVQRSGRDHRRPHHDRAVQDLGRRQARPRVLAEGRRPAECTGQPGLLDRQRLREGAGRRQEARCRPGELQRLEHRAGVELRRAVRGRALRSRGHRLCRDRVRSQGARPEAREEARRAAPARPQGTPACEAREAAPEAEGGPAHRRAGSHRDGASHVRPLRRCRPSSARDTASPRRSWTSST